MSQLVLNTTADVRLKFDGYPENIGDKMEALRDLIIKAAGEIDEITQLEETLKWGEPSYISKFGSTIRIDWKSKAPDQYAIYFKCTSKLVPTFKLTYPDIFQYEGNRAIVFKLDEQIPQMELKRCIKAALMYHKVKQLPLLGL